MQWQKNALHGYDYYSTVLNTSKLKLSDLFYSFTLMKQISLFYIKTMPSNNLTSGPGLESTRLSQVWVPCQ